MKAQRESRVIALVFLTPGLDGVSGQLYPSPLYPWERDPVPILQEAGWNPSAFLDA